MLRFYGFPYRKINETRLYAIRALVFTQFDGVVASVMTFFTPPVIAIFERKFKMEFYPIEMRTDYMKSEYAVADSTKPLFTWGAVNSYEGAYQTAFRIVVSAGDAILWDSGFVEKSEQSAVYGGEMLNSGAIHKWTLQIKDNYENVSRIGEGFFKTACFDEWQGKWIESTIEKEHEVQYFVSDFILEELPKRAVLYHSGIGLDKAYINGVSLNDDRLQPAFTNYKKESQYIIDIVDKEILKIGENVIGIAVAGGWRKNLGEYLDNLSEERKIEFMGNMALNAQLVLYFEDGTKKVIATDENWKCMHGAITHSHLFDGETYDELNEKQEWNTNYNKYEYKPVKLSDFNTLNLKPQVIEPVREKRTIKPVADYFTGGKHIYDFGENFAGVLLLKAKGVCREGTVFKIKHAELLSESGELFTEPLRGAKAEDRYISRGGECDICYAPVFTYHGFRYASLEIEGEFSGEVSLLGISFYTDMDTDCRFRCSDMTVNEFYNCVIRTERANLHSIASDCPQRDERMGWMNDATVRFPAQKYNFMSVRLMEKFVGDVSNEQDEEGRITCTAPFVYGERPADPVCSSYLIAAMEHYLMTGSTDLIKKHYKNFAAWNEYLKTRRQNGILEYSYYGDWAGPEDCCYSIATIGNSDTQKLEEYDTGAANSVFVPGELISTAYHYMNYTMLAEFARLTNNAEDEESFLAEADIVRTAFRNKWCKDSGFVHNGSQACQALALFAGLVEKEYEEEAAKLMNEAVKADGYRLKTGNLTTPMLIKMLYKFGYGDTAWKLFTRCEYPSWGFMMANGATTIWERFELKKECGMNSHSHPMYGASVGALFEGLSGIEIVSPGKEYCLSPYIPDSIKFYEMKIPTIRGSIYIKCEDRYGSKNAYISVPFGVKVNIKKDSITLGAGFYVIGLDR